MKRIYVEMLKQHLIQLHQYADTNIGVVNPQTGKYVINGNDGTFEWDREEYYNKPTHYKYVSITKYLHQWDNEIFKQAYKELVEDGILEPLVDTVRNKTLYRYLPINYEEYNNYVLEDSWKHGPSCPPELMKQDKELKTTIWWKDLKNEFYKNRKDHKDNLIEELQLHHLNNEAYSKCLLCFKNSLTPEKAYQELKNDMILLTEAEHRKTHNRED